MKNIITKLQNIDKMSKNNETMNNNKPMMYDALLNTVAYDIETESFIHKGITLQRLTRDGLWYAIYNNSIIKIDQYRNDIVAWIDCHCN